MNFVMERLSREFGDGLFLVGRGEAGRGENNGKGAVVGRGWFGFFAIHSAPGY